MNTHEEQMSASKAIDLLEDLSNEVYNEDQDGYLYFKAIEFAIVAIKEMEKR